MPGSFQGGSASSAAEVVKLPDLNFRGDLLYIFSEEHCAEACGRLELAASDSVGGDSGLAALGFDIEWRASYERGVAQPRAATVQLAGADVAAVFHLSRCGGVPPALAGLLGRADVLKVGVGAEGDAQKLHRDYGAGQPSSGGGVVVRGVHELNDLARRTLGTAQLPAKSGSLSALCEDLLRHGLPKPSDIRCGNWEAVPLSQQQLDYAATDAWAGLRCFKELHARAPDALAAAVNSPVATVDQGIRKRPLPEDGCARESIAAVTEPKPLPPGKQLVYRLFHENRLTVESIATLRGVQPSTVLSYLTDAIAAGYAYNVEDFDLAAADREAIVAALADTSRLAGGLKAIKEGLPSHIEYWAIKLVQAHEGRKLLAAAAAAPAPQEVEGARQGAAAEKGCGDATAAENGGGGASQQGTAAENGGGDASQQGTAAEKGSGGASQRGEELLLEEVADAGPQSKL